MTHLREEIEADRYSGPRSVEDFRTDHNPHEIICSTCGRKLFADEASYETISRSLEYDADNQFVCDYCIENIEEEGLAH